MTERTELPELNAVQITILERYARFEIEFDDVHEALRGLVEVAFDAGDRWIDERFRIPKPGIMITREHVRNAVSKRRMGQVGQTELVRWACLMLMCEAYQFDSKDQDYIGDWLIDISYGQPHLDRDS